MDRRTKILVSVFAAAAALWLVSAVVYPKWLEPMVTIKDRVAAAQSDLNDLLASEAKVERARFAYKAFLERCGSLDATKLENDLRERLNKLIAAYKLDETSVSGGSSRISSFGKTDARKMTLSVNATGSLEGAIGFLKSVSELPHLIRIGNMTLYPSQASRRQRKGKRGERVQLRVPIEVLVLPQHKMLGRKLAEEELRQPERLVRHQARNYALIWDKTPFTEYIKLDPMVVSAGKDLSAPVGKRGLMLTGTVKGGDGEYTIQWTPSDHLGAPNSLRPRIDTKAAFSQVYTLAVSDTSGNSSTAQVAVTITEKSGQVAKGKPAPTQPKDLGPQRWKDGRQQQLVMAMASRNGDTSQAEVMVYHTRTKANAYYRPGDEFDGGELLFVHPRGAIVRRQSGLFVYPIGANISEDIKADEADDHPNLKRVAALIQEALVKQEAEEKIDAESHDADGVVGEIRATPSVETVRTDEASSSRPGGRASQSAKPADSQDRSVPPAGAKPGSRAAPTPTKGPPATVPVDKNKGAAGAKGDDQGVAGAARPHATKAKRSRNRKGGRTVRRPSSRRKISSKKGGKK